MKVVWARRRAIHHLVVLRNHVAKNSEQNAAIVAQRILAATDLLGLQPEIARPGRILGTRELL